jgi:hypothetical protein
MNSHDDLQSIARMGANTLGIDASKSNIAIASLHAAADPLLRPGTSQLAYLNMPAEALLSEQKRYDVVCAMEVIEHVDHPAVFLSTCAQLLKVRLPFLSIDSELNPSQTAARWSPLSVNDISHSDCISPHNPHRRRYPWQGQPGDPHLFKIRQSVRANPIFPGIPITVCTKLRVIILNF